MCATALEQCLLAGSPGRGLLALHTTGYFASREEVCGTGHNCGTGVSPVGSRAGRPCHSWVAAEGRAVVVVSLMNPNYPPMRPYYRFMRLLSQLAFALYFRGRAFGRDNVPATGGVLLACNHQSFFDPLTGACPLHREVNFMARDSLFRSPWFGRLIKSVNAFPVKRGAADVGAVKEILRRLKAGKVVLVFPEGTRSEDGSIGEINANAMGIAKRAGVAVVPAVIDGAFEAWPRTSLLPRPLTIYVSYAEPITVEQARSWSSERIAEVVSDRMKALLKTSNRKRRIATSHGWLYAPCTCTPE